jgi:hypothetical protein
VATAVAVTPPATPRSTTVDLRAAGPGGLLTAAAERSSMSIGRFADVSGYGGVEWGVIAFHAVIGALFLAGAVQTLASGGGGTTLAGAGLQTLIGLMIAGLGFVVAKAVSRRG